MEDIVNYDHIGQKTGLKRPVALEGLKACLEVGQVMTQDWGLSNKFVLNGKIVTPWLAKWGEVFGLIINVCNVGSFQSAMHNISEGNASCSPSLAKVNHHIGECLGCRLWVKGHGWGLWFFSIKEAILKELLGSKELGDIPSCFSPIVDTP
jgi:hypothetical protein